MADIGAISSSHIDTFEAADSASRPGPPEPRARPLGFRPRAAMLHSTPHAKLSNPQVTTPMPGKVLVTADEGYLTGSMEGYGELTIDIYQVKDEFRGQNLGQQLIAAAVEQTGAIYLRAEMDYTNGQALRRAGGDVSKTPFGKAARALGFELIDQEGRYFIFGK